MKEGQKPESRPLEKKISYAQQLENAKFHSWDLAKKGMISPQKIILGFGKYPADTTLKFVIVDTLFPENSAYFRLVLETTQALDARDFHDSNTSQSIQNQEKLDRVLKKLKSENFPTTRKKCTWQFFFTGNESEAAKLIQCDP